MENQKNSSREAIKTIVSRAVPGDTKKNTKYAANVFEGLAEFTQISFEAEASLLGQLFIFRTIYQPRTLYRPIYQPP